MNKTLFYFLQFTWGLPVNLVGCIILVFLLGTNKIREIKIENGCIISHIEGVWGAFSVGLFIFADNNNYTSYYGIRHEKGHTIQAGILGIFYFFVIALPSLIHASINCKKCKDESYYHFYTERWANNLSNIKYNFNTKTWTEIIK